MVDFSAIAKWPNVPACYGWLSLDRRGDWRLQGDRVTHHGLIEFMNRQYGTDETGCWFVQNGPQRVYVSLATAPWIYRFSAAGLSSHTGNLCTPKRCYLDEEGSVFMLTDSGIGQLDDRDLPRFLDECRLDQDATVDAEKWLEFMEGESLDIRWKDLMLARVESKQLPALFNFQRHPQP